MSEGGLGQHSGFGDKSGAPLVNVCSSLSPKQPWRTKNRSLGSLSAAGTVNWCCLTSSLAHGSKAQAALPLSFALLEALPNSPQQTHKPAMPSTYPDEFFPSHCKRYVLCSTASTGDSSVPAISRHLVLCGSNTYSETSLQECNVHSNLLSGAIRLGQVFKNGARRAQTSTCKHLMVNPFSSES